MRSRIHRIVLTRVVIAFAGILGVSSCGGAREPLPQKPRSVHELLVEAKKCDKEAVEHETMARSESQPTGQAGMEQRCADQPLDHVTTSGTEPLVTFRPCWTASRGPRDVHREEAARLREEAAQYRAEARELLDAEQRACSGLSQDEIDHSPFLHSEDILRVEPVRADGELRGARVLFRKVPGLTVEWMRHAVSCHQARAAVMGYSPRFQSYCPLVLEDVTATVTETEGGIEVLLQSERDDIAAAVLGRAQQCMGICEPQPTALAN